jgi:hypothetical protein
VAEQGHEIVRQDRSAEPFDSPRREYATVDASRQGDPERRRRVDFGRGRSTL